MCLAVIASRSKWKRASHWEWEEERERLLQHWPYLFERVWTWICLLSMWTVFVRLCMLTLSDCTEQTGTHSVKWVPLCVLFLSFFRLSEWVSSEYCLWAMSIGTIGTRANTYIKEKESGTKGAAQTKIKLETDCLMKRRRRNKLSIKWQEHFYCDLSMIVVCGQFFSVGDGSLMSIYNGRTSAHVWIDSSNCGLYWNVYKLFSNKIYDQLVDIVVVCIVTASLSDTVLCL